MLFTQPQFFAFFAAVLAVAWATRRNRHRKIVLLAASYLFYAAWDWRFLSLIIASTVIDFAAGAGLERATSAHVRRAWLGLSLAANLGILAFFKYFNFFIGSVATLLEPLGVAQPDRALSIVLPVGISFFTFQTMSYTIDVYRRTLRPVSSLLDFALFVGFFPQLVAGPIVRAAKFLPQLRKAPSFARVDRRACLTLFLTGFIKKACIADTIAPQIDSVFATPAYYTTMSIWIAVLLYAIQIYCDFSGYTDMAIACAGLLGYRLGTNFDFPYLATNLGAFWRRWHMSLSSWLRDYLYIPLGGSRGSHFTTYRNVFLTMLLGGLWHGAAWTFVAWGAIHGGGMVIQRIWTRHVRMPSNIGSQVLGTVVTFYFVCLAWIFFRAQSFGDAATLLRGFVLFDGGDGLSLSPWLLAWPVILTPVHWMCARRLPRRWLDRAPDWAFSGAFGVAAAVAVAFAPLRTDPFIYFQF